MSSWLCQPPQKTAANHSGATCTKIQCSSIQVCILAVIWKLMQILNLISAHLKSMLARKLLASSWSRTGVLRKEAHLFAELPNTHALTVLLHPTQLRKPGEALTLALCKAGCTQHLPSTRSPAQDLGFAVKYGSVSLSRGTDCTV